MIWNFIVRCTYNYCCQTATSAKYISSRKSGMALVGWGGGEPNIQPRDQEIAPAIWRLQRLRQPSEIFLEVRSKSLPRKLQPP